MPAVLGATDRAAVRQFMADRFNMAELAEVCFDLCLDIEEFPRATKSEFCQALIGYFERQGNLACLLVELLKRRDDTSVGGLLAQVGGCDARKKVQIILSNDVVVTPEIQAALAQLLQVRVDEVAVMGRVTGSTWLLIGLPGPAAARLLALNPRSLVNGKYQVVSILPYAALPPDQQLEWRRRVLSGQASTGPGQGGSGSPPPPLPPSTPGRGDSPAGGGGGGRGCLGWLTLLVIGVAVGGGLLWTVLTRPPGRPVATATPGRPVVRPTAPPTAVPPTPTPFLRPPVFTPPPLRGLPTPTTTFPLTVRAAAAPDPVCYGECASRPTRVTVRAEVQGGASPQAVTLEYRYRSSTPNIPAGAWRKAPMQPGAGGVYTVVVDVGREAYPDLRGTPGVFEYQVVALDSAGAVAQTKPDTVRVEYLIG